MIELAVIVLRLVQYSAASVLMGSALFFVYALPAQGVGSAASLRWSKPLLVSAALLLALATLAGLIAQTATLAGSLADALTRDSLTAVVTQMDLGKSAVARAALALVAAIYAMRHASRPHAVARNRYSRHARLRHVRLDGPWPVDRGRRPCAAFGGGCPACPRRRGVDRGAGRLCRPRRSPAAGSRKARGLVERAATLLARRHRACSHDCRDRGWSTAGI